MTNEEKANEIAMPCQGCECEWTKEKMYKQQYCKDCVAQDKFIAAIEAMKWKDEQQIEQLTAFAQHLNKRGAFRDDLCMDFEHEAQSFIEFREYQNNKEL